MRDSALFYTCSLIELIGRTQRLNRSDVVNGIGEVSIAHIYEYADVLHCEPIAKTADETIRTHQLPTGEYDNVAACRYIVPDYWTIGEVYGRLIEDVCGGDPVKTLLEVYHSWISDCISNYNSDLYYQPRDYLRECYKSGRIL